MLTRAQATMFLAVLALAATAPVHAEILFQDDFNDGNADGWDEYDGVFTVVDGAYQIDSTPEGLRAHAIAGDAVWTDCVIELDFRHIANPYTHTTVVFRVCEFVSGEVTGRHYQLSIPAGTALARFQEFNYLGDVTMLAEAQRTVAFDTWHHLRLEVQGTQATAYIDGSPYLYCNALARYPAGRFALKTEHRAVILYDNVVVVGPDLPALVHTDSRVDGTWSKEANNALCLAFDRPLMLPEHLPLSIRAVAGSPEEAEQFRFAVDPDGVTLRATEIGQVLTNMVWYRILPTADFFYVEPFALDLCTLWGDADGSGRVTTADYLPVKAHMGEITEDRCDLNGTGRVTTADYIVVKDHMGNRAPAKP
jgi:hypothetical protein